MMDFLGDRTNILAVQRLQYFRGCAVIDFTHLFFEDADLLGSREYSQVNVDRLIKIFQIEGCCNLEPEHRIAAVVDSDKLKNALSISGITQEQLLDPTVQNTLGFEEGTRLMCIFGKHRLRAAEALGKRSWLVDIYVDDLPSSSRTQLRDQCPKSLKFTDGEIYRIYRLHKIKKNNLQAVKWWAKLESDTRRKNFRRLKEKKLLHQHFDELLPYIGLWTPLKSDQIQRLLGLKCPEIICQYLKNMSRKWQSIFDGSMAKYVDTPSVALIEGIYPQISLHDQKYIVELVDTNRIFPAITKVEDREDLKNRLLKVEGRLTSLKTLMQDALFLNLPTHALLRLCPRNFKGGLLAVMQRQWSAIAPQQGHEIQTSEHSFKVLPSSQGTFMDSMIQLWLFSLRHFVVYGRHVTPSQAFGQANPIFTLHGLAALATRLGFDSNEIQEIQRQNQARTIAKDFVETICRDEFLDVNESDIRQVSIRFTSIMNALRRRKDTLDQSTSFASDYAEESAQSRFNKPTMHQYTKQRGNMFMEQVFSPVGPPRQFPTSLAITRDILICFFGPMIGPNFDILNSPSPGAVSDGRNSYNPASINEPTEGHISSGEANEEPQGFSFDCEPSPHQAPLPISPYTESLERSPVSLQPHPGGTPDNDHMTWESQVPMAAGFEDAFSIGDLKTKIYMAHHRKIPEILFLWHQSINQSLVVIYLFEDRVFYKFPTVEEFALRAFLTNLAREFTLMEIHSDYGLSIPDVNNIYETALSNHLIVAARKGNPSHKKPQGVEMTLDEFRDYIRTYDVQTGKRYGEDETQRPVKRR